MFIFQVFDPNVVTAPPKAGKQASEPEKAAVAPGTVPKKMQAQKLAEANQNLIQLRTHLNAMGGFSSYDQLDLLYSSAENVVRLYSQLSDFAKNNSDMAGKLRDEMLKLRERLPPSLASSISQDGALNHTFLANTSKFIETTVYYNSIDRALSDFALRGKAISGLDGFNDSLALLTSRDYAPFLRDVLTSRYGANGEGLAQVRGILGLAESKADVVAQYQNMVGSLVSSSNHATSDRAYRTWEAFSGRFQSEASSDGDPVALLAGAGAGGQVRFTYSGSGTNTIREGWRNTFDFASQLVAANTFNRVSVRLEELLLAVKSASTLPAGTQAIFFGREKYFELSSAFNFNSPSAQSPLEQDQLQASMENAIRGDIFGITSRYLSSIYYLQKNQMERYRTFSSLMDELETALSEAGNRVDELQNRIADPTALKRGSIQLPLFTFPFVPYFNPGLNAVDMGRLRFVSLFEGMTVNEITKSMGTQQDNLRGNFLLNQFYADEYVKRMLSMRMTEISSNKNYLHFMPGYESILALMAEKFNFARKNLADLKPDYVYRSATLSAGEGRQADGVALDAQLNFRGADPAQMLQLEGYVLPQTSGRIDWMARGQMTATEVLGVNVWNFMGRIDQYLRSDSLPNGVKVEAMNATSQAELDSTFGMKDGTCRANFYGRSYANGSNVAETYWGTAYLRSNGHWLKVIMDHDAIVRAGLKDALDHRFAMGNLSLGGNNTARAALEANTYDYQGRKYSAEATGVMLVGQLSPAANLVAGTVSTIDKEKASAASVQVGSGTYLTAMTYKFNNRDVLPGAGPIFGSSSGLADFYGQSAKYKSYRLYEKPEEVKYSTLIHGAEVHADNLFRAAIYGGQRADGELKSAVAGAEVTTVRNRTSGGVQYNTTRGGKFGFGNVEKLSLNSAGRLPGLPSMDYFLYANYDEARSPDGNVFGGATYRMDDKKGGLSSVTVFGSTRSFGTLAQNYTGSIALSAKSLNDDVAAIKSPTRENEIYWLERMRYIGNAAIREIPDRMWGSLPYYQLGVFYSSSKGKSKVFDGAFTFGGSRSADGQYQNSYAAALNYKNGIGLFGAYQSPINYTSGLKANLGDAVGGFYLSRVPSGVKNESFTLSTVDFAAKSPIAPGQMSGALSVGTDGSYKAHLLNAANLGEKGDLYAQFDLFRFMLPSSGRIAGWEAGLGFQSQGFDMAMFGTQQLYYKLFGAYGQGKSGAFTGNYIDLNGSLIQGHSSLNLGTKWMFNGSTRYWSGQIGYSYTF